MMTTDPATKRVRYEHQCVHIITAIGDGTAPVLVRAVELAQQCAERDNDEWDENDGDDPHGGLL